MNYRRTLEGPAHTKRRYPAASLMTPRNNGSNAGGTDLRYSLVASAQKIIEHKTTGLTSRTSTADSWQADAWDMYDVIGELAYVSNTLAARTAQARLYVGTVSDNSTGKPVPVDDDHEAAAVFSSLGDTASGRTQILERLALNLIVPGEGYLVGVPRDLYEGTAPDEEETYGAASPGALQLREGTALLSDLHWAAYSKDELSQDTLRGGGVNLKLANGRTIETDLDDIYPIRVWKPHPRWATEAISAVRTALPILRELAGLTMYIGAQIDSRLAGAGVLIVPNEAAQAMRSQYPMADSGDDSDDPFTMALVQAMTAPLTDRASAASLVPMVIRVPGETVSNFRHLSFASSLDANARSMREEAIKRLALSLDAPPEMLTGATTANHWGAWLVREDVVTSHIEPLLALMCQAITEQYLWPVLEAMGWSDDEVRRHAVWYDVSHMIVRPNRAADAQKLHSAGVLSDLALLEANGFSEDDAPAAGTTPASVSLALNIVAQAPSLLERFTLAQIVEQISQVLEANADESLIPDAPGGEGGNSGAGDGDSPSNDDRPADTIPDTYDDPPSEPDAAHNARAMELARQALARGAALSGGFTPYSGGPHD